MKTLEQQIACAKARAMTARIEIDFTYSRPDGSSVKVTSERDASHTYTVQRGADGCLHCDCEARCVCKHIALAMIVFDMPYQVTMAQAQVARLEAFHLVDALLASLPVPAPVDVLTQAEQVAAKADKATALLAEHFDYAKMMTALKEVA